MVDSPRDLWLDNAAASRRDVVLFPIGPHGTGPTIYDRSGISISGEVLSAARLVEQIAAGQVIAGESASGRRAFEALRRGEVVEGYVGQSGPHVSEILKRGLAVEGQSASGRRLLEALRRGEAIEGGVGSGTVLLVGVSYQEGVGVFVIDAHGAVFEL